MSQGLSLSALDRVRKWPAALARIALAVLLVCGAGCAADRRGAALAAELAGNDEDSQVNYWLAVTDRPVVSYDEAFHGLLLFADGRDESPDYASRVAALKQRRMLPNWFNELPEAPARRGVLAVAIAEILEIRGGVLMRITGGVAPRYALRELVYRGVYPPSSENQTFTGVEFAGVIGKLEDFQRISAVRQQVGER